MLPRRWLASVLAAWALSFACAPDRHEFLPHANGGSGSAGMNAGGASDAGRGSGAGSGSGSGGRGGAHPEGGDAGEGASGPDAGNGGDGGAEPAAGSGPIAGGGGSSAGRGGGGGAAANGGSGGASSGSGGASAGAGGAAAGAGGGGAPAVTPTILSTVPEDMATGIRSDQKIVVVFSEPMNQAATEAAFDKQTLPVGTFTWSADSKTMTYTPSTPLLYAQATAPATVQAKLYSCSLGSASKSLAGAQLAAAKTFGFTTLREFSLTLTPSERWSVKAPSSATTWPTTPAAANDATQCTGSCASVPVGDDQAKIGVRSVFRYNTVLPPGAFVEDARMYIGIAFSNGSVANFGSLQLATAPNVLAAGAPTGAVFTFNIGATGTTTTSNVLVPGVISNGSFNTTDLFLSVQWSVATDGDSASDNISLSDGFILTHYLLP